MTLKPTNSTPSPKKSKNKEKFSPSPEDEKSPKKQICETPTSQHTNSKKSVSSSSESSPPTERILKSNRRNKACRQLLPVYPPVKIFPPYQRNYNYPITVKDWNRLMTGFYYARMPKQCRYCGPYPQRMLSPILVPPPPFCCPYTTLLRPPIFGRMLPPPQLPKEIPMPSSYKKTRPSPEQIIASKKEAKYHVESKKTPTVLLEDIAYDVTPVPVQDLPKDADYFLTLPKNVFPTTRTLQMDPNPIIDEMCKMDNFDKNLSWMLDLEFGVPRGPITRPIPIYDVKYNSIHCKNAPSAIHPGFESCSEEFKRVLLFYYDCVISTWYKGYMFMNADNSVENFQSWLLLAMQKYGMCWS